MTIHFRMLKTSVFTSLFSLFLVFIASGEAPPLAPPHTEPLEKSNMPPAYMYRLGTSQRMISQFGPFTCIHINVDVSRINNLVDVANESSIKVNPTELSK